MLVNSDGNNGTILVNITLETEMPWSRDAPKSVSKELCALNVTKTKDDSNFSSHGPNCIIVSMGPTTITGQTFSVNVTYHEEFGSEAVAKAAKAKRIKQMNAVEVYAYFLLHGQEYEEYATIEFSPDKEDKQVGYYQEIEEAKAVAALIQ